jgi:hypothetical protein
MNIQDEIGQSILNKLFEMNDTQLKEKLISITDNNHCDILTNDCDCVRIIRNSIPEKIEFSYYDTLRVNRFGVSIVPENGCHYLLVKFNQHFKL